MAGFVSRNELLDRLLGLGSEWVILWVRRVPFDQPRVMGKVHLEPEFPSPADDVADQGRFLRGATVPSKQGPD